MWLVTVDLGPVWHSFAACFKRKSNRRKELPCNGWMTLWFTFLLMPSSLAVLETVFSGGSGLPSSSWQEWIASTKSWSLLRQTTKWFTSLSFDVTAVTAVHGISALSIVMMAKRVSFLTIMLNAAKITATSRKTSALNFSFLSHPSPLYL